MNFQEIVLKLHEFWMDQGCLSLVPYDVEIGVGTFPPATFFGALGERPWRVSYLALSRRPTDSRYGEHPTRLRLHHQCQVLLKPPPEEVQTLYLESLTHLGIDLQRHDLRFVGDDWDSPPLDAWGLGWEVWLDGMEITRFTYLQQVGGIALDPISVALNYGLERIATFVQKVENIFELNWNDTYRYKDLFRAQEREFSEYNLDRAVVDDILRLFQVSERVTQANLECDLVYPAYDHVLKCTHLLDILAARGAISITDREKYIGRIRKLARGCAKRYLEEPGDPKVALDPARHLR
ncbi:MAG: glycine--tRNA ligase subunit alpha [Candidatus Bipolaricaulia bacterium]